MHRNTVPVLNNRLALNKRQEIVQSVHRNIVAVLVYPFLRELFLLICNIFNVGGHYVYAVGVVAYAAEDHHLARFALQRRRYSRPRTPFPQ